MEFGKLQSNYNDKTNFMSKYIKIREKTMQCIEQPSQCNYIWPLFHFLWLEIAVSLHRILSVSVGLRIFDTHELSCGATSKF